MTPIKTLNGNMCIGSVQFLLLVRKKLEKLSLVFQNCFLIFPALPAPPEEIANNFFNLSNPPPPMGMPFRPPPLGMPPRGPPMVPFGMARGPPPPGKQCLLHFME